MVHSFLIRAHLPSMFWVEAAFAAVFTINRLPTPTLANQSPFEKLFGPPLDYSFLWTFGCECFPNFTASSSNKLQPGPLGMSFLGTPTNTKATDVLIPQWEGFTPIVMSVFMKLFSLSLFGCIYYVVATGPSSYCGGYSLSHLHGCPSSFCFAIRTYAYLYARSYS